MNKATIDGIQAELDALGNSSNEDAAKSVKARYMQKFKGSVVVGDSLTEGLSVYGFLSDQQVFSKIGASVVYGDDMFDQAAGVKPRNAFFAFGMNDMGNFSGDADKFAARYEELITDFRKKSPKTKIYVCSISTPNREAIAGNSSIGHYKEFNKAIRKMCKRMKLPYIDTSAILPDHPELYAPDGIHADPSYYPMWLDMMREAAGI